MLIEFQQAYQGLKAAKDITQGMAALKTEYEVQTKAIELLGIINGLYADLATAQQASATLVEANAALKQQIAELQQWQAERSRYALHQTPAGGYVYRYQPAVDDQQPPHDLCAQCYQDNVKSILQACPSVSGHTAMRCNACNGVVFVERMEMVVMTVGPSPSRWDDF